MKRYRILFLVLILATNLYAQDEKKIDSLLNIFKKEPDGIQKVKILEELYYAYIYSEPEKAKPYSEKARKLSRKIGFKQGEAVALYNTGAYHHMGMRIDSARFYYNLSDKILKSLNDKERRGSILSSLGKLEHIEGNYDNSLKYYNKALKIAKSINQQLHIGNTLVVIGEVYLDKGDLKSALQKTQEAVIVLDTISSEPWRKADALKQVGRIEYLAGNYKASLPPLNEALKIYINSNDNVWEGHTLCDIGNAYHALKDYNKAIAFFNKSLKIGITYKVKDLEANSLGNLGQSLATQKKYDEAIDYILRSNKINEQSNSMNNIIAGHNQIGKAYHGNKDYNNALASFDKAIKLSDSIGLIEELKNGYENRSETYKAIGNLKKAILDKEKFIILKDSIFNTTKSLQFAELRTEFETERKERQILIQKNEIDLLEKKDEINTLYLVLLGFGLLLSLIAFYALRQKLKRSKTEKEKLNLELDFKKKELTTHALHLAKKNEVLENLKQQAKTFKASENSQKGYSQLIRTINFDLKDDNNWENFSRYFEQVHSGFNNTVKQKFPEVTSNELRLMALLKMNLSSKEIANILNISPEGIKKARYRLRKKLGITTEDSLQDLVLSL